MWLWLITTLAPAAVRAGVPGLGQGQRGHGGDVAGVDHADPGLAGVDVKRP
jgi:hypothetical protein